MPPQFFMVLAIALLTAMDSFAKLLMASFPVWQVVFLRYAVALAVLAPFAIRLLPIEVDRRGLAINFLRGAVMVATIFCFFNSLALLPQAVATSVFFTTPLFLTLIAWVALREPVTTRLGIAVAVGFLGVLVILAGKIDRNASILNQAYLFEGLAFALAAAIGYAVAMVMVRLRAQKEPPVILTVLQTMAAIAISGIPATYQWVSIPRESILAFALVGSLGALGMLCLVTAFSRAQAAKLGPFEYTAFLWASFYGYVFFTEVPHWSTALGALVIVGACYYATEKSPAERQKSF